jgi:hypothetical protein
MSSDGTVVGASYSLDRSSWTPVGRLQRLQGFTNPVIGISAFNGIGTPATFDDFILIDASRPDSG